MIGSSLNDSVGYPANSLDFNFDHVAVVQE
jgi:hypothetical protein